MSFSTISTTLSAAVASAGTIVVGYPTGKTAASFYKGAGHKMQAMGGGFTAPDDFTVSFGASTITVTYNGSTTIPVGEEVIFQFEESGEGSGKAEPADLDASASGATITRATRGALTVLNLGAPATADADGICASQAGTASTAMTINGALASGGVATFDVPRNVVAAWTNTATLTVTGTDEYGNALVETSGSGTSMAGKKAFKTITSVVPSANITGATVGSGDVLGLPIYLPGTGYVLKELQDGAAATAGTTVAGVDSAATATTGDVRGSYDPNAACDGSKNFKLVCVLPDPSYLGATQYGG